MISFHISGKECAKIAERFILQKMPEFDMDAPFCPQLRKGTVAILP